MSFKGYEFRIYPNDTQVVMINKTIGCVRKVWNLMLADNNKSYELTNKGKLNSPLSYKKEFSYLSEVDSHALCREWMNLKTAFSRFFKHQNNKPLFKSKKNRRQSYTTYNNHGTAIRFEKGKLRLPKMGLIPIRLHRNVEGKIKSITIKRTPTNKFFVSILTEQEPKHVCVDIPINKRILGIDMSMSGFGVTNEGITFDPPKWFNLNSKNLKRKQQRFSRTQKDSNRHEKARLKVAKVYETIGDQRKDWLNKLSTKLANEYDVIVLEDINLQVMNRRFGKSINQNGFGMFRTMLEYKMKDRMKEVYKVDRLFASSQICSNCGYKNTDLKGITNLKIREWTCPQCHTNHNRDINAAKNLVKEYNRIQTTDAMSGTVKKARGDRVRPSKSKKRITKVIKVIRRKAMVNEARKIESKNNNDSSDSPTSKTLPLSLFPISSQRALAIGN